MYHKWAIYSFKNFPIIYIIGLITVFNFLNANAQIALEQIRNTDTVTYYLLNPEGNNAEFTWTITGGSIAGHTSPYTAVGADTIQVIWDDSNKTTANYGSLKVSKVINWAGGASCTSPEEQIDIESWVQPKAITDTTGIIVCPNEPFSIKLDFEGNPAYKYKWKLYDKDNPTVILVDTTAAFLSTTNTSTDIELEGIENLGSAEKIYVFEVSDVQDAIEDGMPGDISMGRVNIHVQSRSSAGTLNSTNSLIRR